MTIFVQSSAVGHISDVDRPAVVKLPKKSKVALRAVLGLLERGQGRLMADDVLICLKQRDSTTSLHLTNAQGEHCISVNKHIGSEIALLHSGISQLRGLLEMEPRQSVTSTDDIANSELPARDKLYAFLEKHYKHNCFAGRNDPKWCEYSQVVTDSCLEELRQEGYTLITHHSSRSGEAIYFDSSLTLIEPSIADAAAMAGLSKKARTLLVDILNKLKGGQAYLYRNDLLLCQILERKREAGDFFNAQYQCCAPISKQRGSDHALVDTGITYFRIMVSDR